MGRTKLRLAAAGGCVDTRQIYVRIYYVRYTYEREKERERERERAKVYQMSPHNGDTWLTENEKFYNLFE